ncbi:hypothetical protein TSO221_25140 [Azospirillum sp. TSO22-1]|nr:hypothetical protein TSO221_25140 [Azospirillum sp. TSO22-1]
MAGPAKPGTADRRSAGLAASAAPVAVARFTTEGLAPQDRFAIWKDSISVLFEVQRRTPAADQADDFHASLTTIQLGGMLLAETTASAQIFHRDLRRICADGVDHYMIQLYCAGEARARFHEEEQTIAAGDLLFIDAAQPSSFVCDDFSNLTLVAPRVLLDARLPHAERLHGSVLHRDQPITRLAGETLRLLNRLGPGFDGDTAEPGAEAVLDLVVRCLTLAGSGHPAGTPAQRMAMLTAIKRFLEMRLADPALGPDAVLGSFRMSRAYLYELFEPHGGVVRYIQQRRLVRCLAMLRDPSSRRRKIADIAFAHGFTSESHFSRAFSRAFGMTPRTARNHPAPAWLGEENPPAMDDLIDRRYEAWLRAIGA